KIEYTKKIFNRIFPESSPFHRSLKIATDEQIKESIFLHDKSKEEIEKYLISKGERSDNIDIVISQRERLFETFEQLNEKIKNAFYPFINFNNEGRFKMKIFSMSDSYNISSQWAKYGNDNKGFCIEYDFTKVKNKEILDEIYKVIYSKERVPFPYHIFFEMIFSGENKKEELINAWKQQLLTKDISWEPESEWRLVLDQMDNKLDLDIVSA